MLGACRIWHTLYTSLDMEPSSMDPTLASVEPDQVLLTTLERDTQVPAVSLKSSNPQHNVKKQPLSLHDVTDMLQATPVQSRGSPTIGLTGQLTVAAARPRPERNRVLQGMSTRGSDVFHHRGNRRNLVMLAKLRKPPRTDPSGPIVQRHESREVDEGLTFEVSGYN